MKTIMIFGTFDILHKGHTFFLKSAKALGEKLVVVIARDDTVKKIKQKEAVYSENIRLKNMRNLKIANKVILGAKKDKLKIIEKIRPDVIALGYDQNSFTKGLSEELKKRNIFPKVVRIKAYKPHIHKSSKLREKLSV